MHPILTVSADDIIEKYGISKQVFEEHVLNLEFHFVCCLGYRKVNDHWKEIVTPFYEWREYLTFLRSTETNPIATPHQVVRKRPHDFAFIQDMTILLNMAKKQPIALIEDKQHHVFPSTETLCSIAEKMEGVRS